MPITTYEGETFVAYLDISGFKELMKKGDKAEKALGKFYSTVYDVGRDFQHQSNLSFVDVNAVLFSDCAILFARNPTLTSNEVETVRQNKIKSLQSVLVFVKRVNCELILSNRDPMMTVCSIDYGKFKYEDRIEFEGIDKGFVVGKPFVNVFLDIESGKPKIQPSECRILRSNVNLDRDIPSNDEPFSLLEPTSGYYYYHWMLQSLREMRQFKQDYQDTYQLRYAGMIQVLQKYVSRTRTRHTSDSVSL